MDLNLFGASFKRLSDFDTISLSDMHLYLMRIRFCVFCIVSSVVIPIHLILKGISVSLSCSDISSFTNTLGSLDLSTP